MNRMPAPSTASPATGRFGWWLLMLLSLGVAGYALAAYLALPLGTLVHPDMRAAFEAQPGAVYTHIVAGSVALVLAPWQFVARWRARQPRVHRWTGRAYLLLGVLPASVAGFVMALQAQGGAVGRWGFGLLAVLWLASALQAWAAIRRGDVAAHRRWMVRNVALTLAAVTLRLWLPGAMVLNLPFQPAYAVIAWACWVPNLLVAELMLRRRPAGLT